MLRVDEVVLEVAAKLSEDQSGRNLLHTRNRSQQFDLSFIWLLQLAESVESVLGVLMELLQMLR